MFRTLSISARLLTAAVAIALTFTFATTSPADVVLDPNSRNLPTDIDTPELEVTYSIGFVGAIWQNAISPVTFKIKNISPDFFSGTIEIKPNRYSPEIHRLPIEVGQNSLRRFSLGINLPSFVDGLELRIVRDGNPVWQRSLSSSAVNSVPTLRYDRPPPILAVAPDHTKASVGQSDPFYRNREIFRIAPWELPDHEPILGPFGGVFLSKTVDLRSLAGPRIKALARYVAHGGTLFVPAESTPWMQKLADELPYKSTVSPVAPTPVGLGLLVPYVSASEDPTPPWSQPELLIIPSSRPAPNYAEFFQSHQYSTVGRGPRSQNSIGTVTFFIIGYLIAAGPLLFFFRRAKRKNVIRVLVVIIGLASVLSVSLGVYLRSSRGDLAWSSMTCLGEGGATQTAVLALSSAGARTHHIDTGSDFATIDPFDFLPNRYIHPSNYQNSGQSLGKFYQGSITHPIATKSTDVLVSPLGSKRIHIRAPVPDVLPLEFDIKSFKPQGNNLFLVSVSIKNPNPYPILNPLLVYVDKPGGSRSGGRVNPLTFSIPLATIPANGNISGDYISQRPDYFDNFRMNLQSYNPPKPREPRPLFAPSFPSPSAWDPARLILLGTIDKSPAFNFTGDFIEFTGSHYISQYIDIPPETAPKLSGSR